MNKYEQVVKVSNPREVMKRGKDLGIVIYLSNRKDKKYAIYHPITNKVVNFGAIQYQDATFHNDPIRIAKFKQRNHKWADAKPYTPAWASWTFLW
jgi:hypothetical protein